MLKLLIELFGKGYIRKIMGTRANVTKPIKMDKNSPYKLYSDKAFNDPDLLFTIEKKLEEYGPYVLSNKNASEVANYEMNARRVLNARKQKEESTVKSAVESMFGPLGKKTKPEAEIVDIRTQQKVDDTGIMKLKKELGLPEGVAPGSVADKAIKESAEYKMNQQGVKSLLDEDYVPPKSELTLEEEDAVANIGAKAYSANIESYRRPIVREMLLKDTRIKLSDDVRKSLENKDDLQRGANPEMDPLRLLNKYYDVNFNKLDELEEIRFTARNETEAADEFLQRGGLEPKKDPDGLAEGGRIGFAAGGIKFLLNLINKRAGKDVLKTADKIDRPESALNKDMFGAFEDRLNRQILDVPETPSGFKLSRERLLKNYPEIDESFADEIMTMDRDMQIRIIEMLKDRRKDPKAYDKLLMEKGDTLDFQGEFDRSIQRSKNAGGGLNYLMGL